MAMIEKLRELYNSVRKECVEGRPASAMHLIKDFLDSNHKEAPRWIWDIFDIVDRPQYGSAPKEVPTAIVTVLGKSIADKKDSLSFDVIADEYFDDIKPVIEWLFNLKGFNWLSSVFKRSDVVTVKAERYMESILGTVYLELTGKKNLKLSYEIDPSSFESFMHKGYVVHIVRKFGQPKSFPTCEEIIKSMVEKGEEICVSSGKKGLFVQNPVYAIILKYRDFMFSNSVVSNLFNTGKIRVPFSEEKGSKYDEGFIVPTKDNVVGYIELPSDNEEELNKAIDAIIESLRKNEVPANVKTVMINTPNTNKTTNDATSAEDRNVIPYTVYGPKDKKGKVEAEMIVYNQLVTASNHPLLGTFSVEDIAGNEIGGLMAYLADKGYVRAAKVIVRAPNLVGKEKKKDGTKVTKSRLVEATNELLRDVKKVLDKYGYKLELTKPTARVKYFYKKVPNSDKPVRHAVITVILTKKGVSDAEKLLHKLGIAPNFEGVEKVGSLCKYYSQPGIPALVAKAIPSTDKGFGDGQAYMHVSQIDKLVAVLKGILAVADELPSKAAGMVERTLNSIEMAKEMGTAMPIIKGFASSSTLFGKGNIKFLNDEDWKAMFGDTPAEIEGKPVLKGDANWFKKIDAEGEQDIVFFLHDTREAQYKKRMSGLALAERLMLFDYANESVKKNFDRVEEAIKTYGISSIIDRAELQDIGFGIYTKSEIAKTVERAQTAILNRVFNTEDKIGYFTIEPAIPAWNVAEDEIVLNPIWKAIYKEDWAIGYRAPILGPQALFFGKVRFDERVAINAIVFGNNEEVLANNLGADFDGDGVFLIGQNTKLHKEIMKKYSDENGIPKAPRLKESPLGLVGEFKGEVSRDKAIVNSLVSQWAVGLVDNYLSALFAKAVREGIDNPHDIIEHIWDGIEATQGIVKMIKKPGLAPVWETGEKVPEMTAAHCMSRGKDVNPYGGAPAVEPDMLEKVADLIKKSVVKLEEKAIMLATKDEIVLQPQDIKLRNGLVGIALREREELQLEPTGYEQGTLADARFDKTKKEVNDLVVEWVRANLRTSRPVSADFLVRVIVEPDKLRNITDPEKRASKLQWYATKRFTMLGRVFEDFKYLGPSYRLAGDESFMTTYDVAIKRNQAIENANKLIAKAVMALGGGTGTYKAADGTMKRWAFYVSKKEGLVNWKLANIIPGKPAEVVEDVIIELDQYAYVDPAIVVEYVKRIAGGYTAVAAYDEELRAEEEEIMKDLGKEVWEALFSKLIGNDDDDDNDPNDNGPNNGGTPAPAEDKDSTLDKVDNAMKEDDNNKNTNNTDEKPVMKTTVVNKKETSDYDVYIGRPSKWGNPFTHKKGTKAQYVVESREAAVEAFRKWILEGEGRYLLKDLHELKGKKLACWCKPHACHGDVLAELADNAEKYMATAPKEEEKKVTKDGGKKGVITIYVDGSWSANHPDKAGWGFVTEDGKHKANGVIDNPQSRQIDGELEATIQALRWAYVNGYRDVIIAHDYEGVAKWADGEWKTKKQLTKDYKATIDKARLHGMVIKFKKISGEINPADLLATEALGIKSVHNGHIQLGNHNGLPEEKAMFETTRVNKVRYAGIGARKTPAHVLKVMEEVAKLLSEKGVHLHTGGAHGADSAFYKGANGKATVFVPWPKYNELTGSNVIVSGHDKRAAEIAAKHHPAWNKLSQGAKKLMTRNVHVLLSRDLDSPVDAVICWTENGKIVGGTGHALRVAKEAGIPVINLATLGENLTVERVVELFFSTINGNKGGPP